MIRSSEKHKFLIYTDMDGTLLDHNNYSFAPALCTLDELACEDLPVIPNTSKTKAELAPLRQTMGLRTPFIVENGAAVYIPKNHFKQQPAGTAAKGDYWLKEFARPRAHWLDELEAVKAAYSDHFTHFEAMTLTEIQVATGLSLHNAQLAKQREYGEPILWLGDSTVKKAFIQTLQSRGAKPIQGGRFLHLCGESNKGEAMLWLTKVYQSAYPEHALTSIALGDGQNDIAMLEAADIAVRVASPVNPLPDLKRTTGIYNSKAEGPTGWSEAIAHLVFQRD